MVRRSARAASSETPFFRRPKEGDHPSRPGGDQLRTRSERARGRGHVDVVLVRVSRDRGKDADDGVRTVVHAKNPSDDRGIPAEASPPERVAQHEDRFGRVPFVAPTEAPAEPRAHAEQIEEVPGDDAGLYPLRLLAAEQDEPHRVVLDDPFESRVLVPVILELGDRERAVVDPGRGSVVTDPDEPLAAAIGKRLQKNSVNGREDRRVRSDSQSQREDGDRRVRRVAPKSPQAVAQVLPDRFEEAAPPGVAALFLDLVQASEAPLRRGAGFFGGHPLSHVLGRFHLEVETDLFAQLLVEPPLSDRPPEAAPEDPPHRRSSAPTSPAGCARPPRTAAPSSPSPRRADGGPRASRSSTSRAGCSRSSPTRS